jgi:hypothetical protein
MGVSFVEKNLNYDRYDLRNDSDEVESGLRI